MRLAIILLASSLSVSALASDELQAGKTVFTQAAVPSCTVCHTLSDAGSAGQIGPNLDTMKPSLEQVFSAVSQGVGIMPSYETSLTEQQRRAVASYVSTVAGS